MGPWFCIIVLFLSMYKFTLRDWALLAFSSQWNDGDAPQKLWHFYRCSSLSKSLDESERGELKASLKAQHSENQYSCLENPLDGGAW